MAKISIKRISELAGVSKTTVSFVLNGRGDEMNISSDTQTKIIDIAKKHNYQANFIARSLSLGKTFTIGLIVPDISNPFYGKVARYIEKYAEQEGYSVIFASTGEDFIKEQKLVEQFNARQVDGIILATSAETHKQIFPYSDGSHSVIFFDRIFKDQKEGFVDINNFESAKILTDQLIQQGHKRIALVSITSYLPNIDERIRGYKDALKENSIEFKSDQQIEVDHINKKASIVDAFKLLFEQENYPTALLFLNNVLAAEGIWVINRHYPHLVNELLFASFDNLDMFDYALPKVISALQPTNIIAEQCIRRLCAQIEKAESIDGIKLETEIILR